MPFGGDGRGGCCAGTSICVLRRFGSRISLAIAVGASSGAAGGGGVSGSGSAIIVGSAEKSGNLALAGFGVLGRAGSFGAGAGGSGSGPDGGIFGFRSRVSS